MSGKSIQRTLTGAFGAVGRILGWNFSVYRPVQWIEPMQDANFIRAIKLSATPDEAYTKDPGELDKFLLYTGAVLELGDIVHSDELDKTYVVMDKTELRATIGALAQDRFDILRPTVTAGADKPMGFEEIATNVPGALKIAGSSSSDGALKVTSSTMSAASHTVEVWSWLPAGFVKLNDVLQLGENRYLITFAQSTAKGTKLKAISTKVGK
jgi:hypothetical protein